MASEKPLQMQKSAPFTANSGDLPVSDPWSAYEPSEVDCCAERIRPPISAACLNRGLCNRVTTPLGSHLFSHEKALLLSLSSRLNLLYGGLLLLYLSNHRQNSQSAWMRCYSVQLTSIVWTSLLMSWANV